MGELRVQSALGQQLKASLTLLGVQNDVAQSCIKARIETADGGMLSNAVVTLASTGASRLITLTTRQSVQEPAVKVVVDVACDAQIHREFMILLDPPMFAGAPSRAELPLAQPDTDSTGSAAVPATTASTTASRRAGAKRPSAVTNSASPVPRLNPDELPARVRVAKVPKDAVPAKSAKAPKDVLKLSDDAEVIPQQGLRLSDTLTEHSATADQQQNMAELRLAQAELAALLRGENPEKASGDQVKAGQQKLQALQMEVGQMKRQEQANRAELEAMRESSFSRNWIVALAGLLLLGLIAIVVLLLQLRRLTKRNEFAWAEQHTDKADTDRKMSVEEIVNSVQASYQNPTTVPGQAAEASIPAFLQDKGAPATAENSTAGALAKNTSAPVKSASAAPLRSSLPSLEDTNSSTFNFFAAKGSSMKVEEISDVTQEAEFWMSVNDPQRAIEILEPQGALEAPDSPVPWLYLLDLYRVTKNKEKYDEMRDRFVLIFNANIPDFEVDPADSVARQLEDFEHLMAKICGMWDTNDILPFLQSLLVDDRDGKRMGFELPVYRDILLLIAIANELERAKSQGGFGGKWVAEDDAVTIPDVATLNRPEEDKTDFNSIDFEVIDFPKSGSGNK
ncbi:FimV family protein [Undibacterium sp.]|uniref:type IV pilus assembly protein FimV n=1 Tax=Undibacterium sp. TaxID=1914977 RepID=UPI00374D3490